MAIQIDDSDLEEIPDDDLEEIPDGSNTDVTSNVLQHPLYRIGRGFMQLPEGAARLAAHATGIGKDTIDKYIAEQYKQDIGANPGFDGYRLLGEALSPLPIVGKVGKALEASKTINPIVKSVAKLAIPGYTAGVLSPEASSSSEQYAKDKINNTMLSTGVGAGLGSLGNIAAKTLSMTTPLLSNLSGSPLKTVYDIKRSGTKSANKAYNEFKNGVKSVDDLTTIVENSYAKLKQSSFEKYMANKARLEKDAQVLPFDGIEKQLAETEQKLTYKGQVIDKDAYDMYKAVKDKVNTYKALNPNEYHTPIGMDALKRQIASLKVPRNKNDVLSSKVANVVDDVSRAIGYTIKNNAPLYEKMVGDSSADLKILSDLKYNLSVGKQANAQTVISKLDKALSRPHVENKLKMLDEKTGSNTIPSIAGYLSKPWINKNVSMMDIMPMIASYAAFSPLHAAGYIGTRSPNVMSKVAGTLGNINSRAPFVDATIPDFIKQYLIQTMSKKEK